MQVVRKEYVFGVLAGTYQLPVAPMHSLSSKHQLLNAVHQLLNAVHQLLKVCFNPSSPTQMIV